MQIVIDIPDSLYENILICWENIHPKVWKILKDGTVLPKNHGRLIDADETLKKHCVDLCKEKPSCHEDCLIYDLFHLAPTIIEADKEVDL